MSGPLLRVLWFGGRDYWDRDAVAAALSMVPGPFLGISGGAPGADRVGKEWCLARGWPCITMDAAWGALGKSAGAMRNSWMLEYAQPQYAIEFPGGKGTADMRGKVIKAGITLWTPYG